MSLLRYDLKAKAIPKEAFILFTFKTILRKMSASQLNHKIVSTTLCALIKIQDSIITMMWTTGINQVTKKDPVNMNPERTIDIPCQKLDCLRTISKLQKNQKYLQNIQWKKKIMNIQKIIQPSLHLDE